MSKVTIQRPQILSTGCEQKTSKGLDLSTTTRNYDYSREHYDGVIVPLRFRQVNDDPTYHKAFDKGPVFQDILWLAKSYSKLIDKTRKNLYSRLDKKQPKRPHWYAPWRKQCDSEIGLRLFIAYQLGTCDVFTKMEINEANWPDVLRLFRNRVPTHASFQVDWWFKDAEEMIHVEDDASLFKAI